MDTKATTVRELTARDLEAVNGGVGIFAEASDEYLLTLSSKLTEQDHQSQLSLMHDMLGKLKHSHWPPAPLRK